MGNIFLELTIILCLAAFLSVVFKFFKQPSILAYILTGIIVGPFGQLQLKSNDFIQAMGELGITLLLFIMGLEIRLKDFHSIGKTAIAIGVLQVFITQAIAYPIALALGFSPLSSFYISIALAFSSTIFVVKLLSDKKDLNSLYGKISIGVLLVQDLLAILFLVFLSSFNQGSFNLNSFPFVGFISALLKAGALFLAVIFLSKSLFPKILSAISDSSEVLFLTSIAWMFGLSALVSAPFIGLSIEIGGFLAGLALANAYENLQIGARVRPLRDFFITIFFIFLGMKMIFGGIKEILLPSVIFIFLVIILKPLVVMITMGILGYRKRTSFLTGISLAQISEFSLIIIFLGNKLGHLSNSVVFIITLVAITTFTMSAYIIPSANFLYRISHRYLKIFERKNILKEEFSALDGLKDLKDHIVLIGANRMGESILEAINHLKEKVLVVDFNPDVIKKLKDRNVNSFFGDISDLDIQERANLQLAKLVISTVPDMEDNLLLIKVLRQAGKTKIIVAAGDFADAKKLYQAGADYVVMPHLAGGRHIAQILEENNLSKIERFKDNDLAYL